MALTIKGRLTLWYLMIFGTIIIGAGVAIYVTFENNERHAVDNELRDYTSFLLSETNTSSKDVSKIFADLLDVATRVNLRFRAVRIILAMRDSIVYDPTYGMGDGFIGSLGSILPGQNGERFRTIWFKGQEYRVLGVRSSTLGSEEIGIVMVTSLLRLHDRLKRFRYVLIGVILLALLISGGGGWLLARSALAPVDRIRQAAEAIGSGNLSDRLPVGRSKDELANLAGTFNDMLVRIEDTFQSHRRFVADASHDIRTPLMVLGTRIDRLLRKSDLSDADRAELKACTSDIDRLGRLSSDLLLLAHVDAHQLRLSLRTTRIDDLLLESIEGLKALAAERNVALWLDIDDPIEIDCDVTELRRAITNVVDNAIKYSSSPGTVRIQLKRGADHACLVVQDDGAGVTEEEMPHIFDRFFRGTVSRTTPGSGLGLAITRTIVEAHRGSVSLVSGAGQGTTVTILLPLAMRSTDS